MSNRIKISHNHINFVITKPNTLCEWRAKTFSSKEPETLSWIDSFVKDSIFWDIGANIGLYSIYSNKKIIARFGHLSHPYLILKS